MKELLLLEKTKKIDVNKCTNCSSTDLVPVQDHEHEFDNKLEKHDGMLCNNCGCFHFNDVMYEYTYNKSLFDSKEVDWKICNN